MERSTSPMSEQPALQSEVKVAPTHVPRSVQRWSSKLQRASNEFPSLFMILPRMQQWKHAALGSETFALHLICSSPGHFHLCNAAPYSIHRPREFLARVAPYLLLVRDILKQSPASVWEQARDAEEVVSFMSSTMNIAVGEDAQRAALHELAVFLNEVGSPPYQGLSRVQLDTGEVAWMCNDHRIAYRASIVNDLGVALKLCGDAG